MSYSNFNNFSTTTQDETDESLIDKIMPFVAILSLLFVFVIFYKMTTISTNFMEKAKKEGVYHKYSTTFTVAHINYVNVGDSHYQVTFKSDDSNFKPNLVKGVIRNDNCVNSILIKGETLEIGYFQIKYGEDIQNYIPQDCSTIQVKK